MQHLALRLKENNKNRAFVRRPFLLAPRKGLRPQGCREIKI